MLPKHKYIPILKFRLSNHRFAVERGRWNNSKVPHSERKCNKCNLNDLGDEFHYLLICPHFKQKRIQLLPRFLRYLHQASNPAEVESQVC